MLWRYIYLAALGPLLVTCVRIIESGPKFPPTKGEVWPKPQHQMKKRTYYVLDNHCPFNVTTPYHTCDILEQAVARLLISNLIVKNQYVRKKGSSHEAPEHNDVFFKGTFSQIHQIVFRIELTKECEKWPHLDMDESYKLDVGDTIVLSSDSIWGIIRGLETFNHLLYFSDDYSQIRFNTTSIVDYPAYKYRGLLIDTGRHYLSPDTIYRIIDAMEMNKLNVLHWHIVDDQSFPYQSEKFPTLSEKGAYHSSMLYTKDEIRKLVEHARLAGIRVIPEFDVPGHVRSWGEAYPDLLTKCYQKKEWVGLGPLNPIKNQTFAFLEQLYKEVKEWFPDEYIHLGGDEVDLSCWESNPTIRDFMKKHNLTTKMLHAQFMKKVKTLLPPHVKFIMWQEVFDAAVPLPKTLIQVWKYGWIKEMEAMIEAGHQVVVSTMWYLDYLQGGWEKYYRTDPRLLLYNYRFKNATGLENIVGGEACMWGEKADEQNIMSRVWPRTSAAAERLWTGLDYTSVEAFEPMTHRVRRRIEEHSCRMIQRGIGAEPPNGPSYCVDTVQKKLRQVTVEYLLSNKKSYGAMNLH